MNEKSIPTVQNQETDRASAGGLAARIWQALTGPHASITEKGERGRAQVLSTIAFILSGSLTWGILSIPTARATFAALISITLLTYVLSRTRYYNAAAYIFSYGFTSLTFLPLYLGTASAFASSMSSTGHVAVILASLLLPIRGYALLVLLSALATIGAPLYAQTPIDLEAGFFRELGVFISISAILLGGSVYRRRIEQERLGELRQANSELEGLAAELETRVDERTKALATSAEVSRRLSTILDLPQLVAEVVEQVRSAFDYYHAHIYLVDEASGDLVMAGGTGEAGAQMLAGGHRVPRGRGLVGRAAETNQLVLVADTLQDPGWLPNTLLPETRSEVAVPIAIGAQVLGVLDVQHNVTDGLRHEDAVLLSSIAHQVAVAMRNARSFEQSRAQAESEAMINTINAQIQRAANLDDVLRTAIREVGRALGATRVSASLNPAAADPRAAARDD